MKTHRLPPYLVFLLLPFFLLSDGWAQNLLKVVQIESVLEQFSGDESTWPHQQTDRWCWAASAEIIMSSYGHTAWKQCIQADDAFPNKSLPRTCCDDPENVLCNRSNWPQFEYYGFQSTPGTLTWDQLKIQVDHRQPVAVAVGFKQRGGGHMGVVAGYAELEGGERLVLLVDPDGHHSGVWNLFDEIWGDSSEIWTHWRDYYDIRPLP